ncbi:hypothetical protein D1872_308230 [compost metagenome]
MMTVLLEMATAAVTMAAVTEMATVVIMTAGLIPATTYRHWRTGPAKRFCSITPTPRQPEQQTGSSKVHSPILPTGCGLSNSRWISSNARSLIHLENKPLRMTS